MTNLSLSGKLLEFGTLKTSGGADILNTLNIVRMIIETRDSYRANFTGRHRKLRSV